MKTGKNVKKCFFCIFFYKIIMDFTNCMDFGMSITVMLLIRYDLKI